MSAAQTNSLLAAEVLSVLRGAGVRTLVVCPGGRNAPLVLCADASRDAFEVLNFFEERSAGFFALGRIRRDNRPVAVVTTSGTAAAELLPAMLEAAHGGWPLIAVTADRPRRLRGTGAPQTIDQPPLFAAARIPVIDIDAPGQLTNLPQGAVHLNVCFDEPLVGE
ncbi:MAG: thiamine pyrophosphate-binding protein, partial [Chthoniobacterales bacterium]